MDRAEFDRELAAFDEVIHRMSMELLSLADGDPRHHVVAAEMELHFNRMQKIMDRYHLENDCPFCSPSP